MLGARLHRTKEIMLRIVVLGLNRKRRALSQYVCVCVCVCVCVRAALAAMFKVKN